MTQKIAAKTTDPTSKKLQVLADHIEQMPHQPDFLGATKGKHEFNMFRFAALDIGKGGAICGSVCCVAGEALRVFEPKTLKKCYKSEALFSDEAGRVLGITEQEADVLFCGFFSPKGLEDIQPKEAADHLRRLAQVYVKEGK